MVKMQIQMMLRKCQNRFRYIIWVLFCVVRLWVQICVISISIYSRLVLMCRLCMLIRVKKDDRKVLWFGLKFLVIRWWNLLIFILMNVVLSRKVILSQVIVWFLVFLCVESMVRLQVQLEISRMVVFISMQGSLKMFLLLGLLVVW